MTDMTAKECFARVYAHKEADRIPIIDSPWAGTLRRWRNEEMPANADWCDYFGVDKVAKISVDITPRYEEQIVEEDDFYITKTTKWGVTHSWMMGTENFLIIPYCWKTSVQLWRNSDRSAVTENLKKNS